jgi:hypothetical protein
MILLPAKQRVREAAAHLGSDSYDPADISSSRMGCSSSAAAEQT